MDYQFSDRISSLHPSAIREIFKVLQDKEVISFAGGNPSPDTFPATEMARIAAVLFENDYAAALQYGITEGYQPLRDITAKRLKEKFDIGRDFDDLVIVTGGQQGIELATKVLVNEGDTVLCEQPSFIGALNAFRSYNARLVGIPVDRDGMDMDKLELALRQEKDVRFIYVIPTFQNPAGVTMSLARRKRLLELAKQYDVMIVEDNPYFELRYSGEYVPPLKALDESGRVVYIGSYSKTICPGMRLGFVCGPKPVVSKIVTAKQIADVHTNQFFMMLVAKYIQTYDFDRHIELARKQYTVKRDRMLAAMDKHFKGKMDWNVPDGGLFIWGILPDGYDGAAFCRMIGKKKVAAVPGSAFMCDETQVSSGVRFNFSMPTLEQIDKGIEIAGSCLSELLGG